MNLRQWNNYLKKYAKANNKKAVIQIINTLLPYILLMSFSVYLIETQASIITIIPIVLITGGFMVRVFILFHDCTHESFVEAKRWNDILGHIFGIFAFTPYVPWKRDHNIHHGSVGNLDRRGVGDIWTMTVDEYRQGKWYKRGIYRIYRNPIFLFGIAPIFLFAVINRFPRLKASKKEWISCMITNGGIILVSLIFSKIFFLKSYLIAQLLVIAFASSMGVWLFYIQHQFEEVYWMDNEKWNFVDAALSGSTFYKLPLVLEWITGYIGYHHIHHLNAKIPNYHLKECYKGKSELREVKTVTLLSSLPLGLLQLYDEKKELLVSYKQLCKSNV
ncbi:fatty acid desaturase [Anaeromicrobium sediminis]|uniref:Fatty acid desaturase domain-containing protein n=1 Tax=Anaeromicrobium sediminis TaxID=1478221 RepID=A0A267MGT1_9FIRM|nr:fatty acid desaturase [Anaeromicrobium sediminis]PAB58779.1 hypothetical protein CCE28_12850 [Anaeromicrobium sediminis]